MQSSKGIHHITAITADPQRNLDFYEGFLGQRLIKKTVNFDDPRAYHLYYGDAVGSPGTILTFFYWPSVSGGSGGVGEVSAVSYAIDPGSFRYWTDRGASFQIDMKEESIAFGTRVITCLDPDGLRIHLVADDSAPAIHDWDDSPVPSEHALRGFFAAHITLQEHAQLSEVLSNGLGFTRDVTDGSTIRYRAECTPGAQVFMQESPDLPRARQGAGSVHHIAFQADNDAAMASLRSRVNALQIASTGTIDRQYFHSTYFMTPAGVLFEIATDDIGFTVDEDQSVLGEQLKLPRQYEAHRAEIEASLVPLSLPRHKTL